MTKKQTSITIREVAARAGVSVATVSRYLNQKTRVSPEAADRIARVTGELHYLPQSAARQLASSRTKIVGFLLVDLSLGFWGPLLDGIEAVVREHDYNLLVAACEASTRRRLPVGPHNTDGLIVLAGSLLDEQVGQLSQANFPMVVIDCLSTPFPTAPTRQIGQMAAEQLFNLILAPKTGLPGNSLGKSPQVGV
jgi:LacI family transcriptional regulator